MFYFKYANYVCFSDAKMIINSNKRNESVGWSEKYP